MQREATFSRHRRERGWDHFRDKSVSDLLTVCDMVAIATPFYHKMRWWMPPTGATPMLSEPSLSALTDMIHLQPSWDIVLWY